MADRVEIPMDADADAQALDVAVNGLDWRFTVRWNVRAQAYALELENSEGEIVIAGRLLRVNADALEGSKARLGVSGVLTVEDLTGRGEAPTRGGLGDRWRLVWLQA
jgi:hypothetical protein